MTNVRQDLLDALERFIDGRTDDQPLAQSAEDERAARESAQCGLADWNAEAAKLNATITEEREARRKAEERAKGQTDDARRAIAELQQARAAEEAAVREAEDLRAQIATARGAASTWESVAAANKATAEQARASVAELERKVEELTAALDAYDLALSTPDGAKGDGHG
jgi:colicin import membrane protein